jgi:hypothetical protein
MAEETALRADPRLAQLRRLLSQARVYAVPFPVAWSAATRAVLCQVRGLERDTLVRALCATEPAWRSAYEGQPFDRVDWALCELEGYATDGELDHLHPVA